MNRDNVVDIYCAAWGEADPIRRDGILKPVWAERATYTDPTAHLVSRSELIAHIGQVLAHYPGSHIERTSAVDAHHSVARFTWKMILADGSSLPEGIDFVEFTEAGTLNRVVGFFGPLSASGAARR
ncbi:nuclear transport factor 2 family protein [Mesorhizobium sp. INR15]|uniref:nuclear transport factor 2 family protein n=1 Tax=Mesorhizobium sp. INR15 TaxID=2654248 RepID=UPI0018965093|nr:nuclear transport factor 2 family protein [Mesorhizobium sp. INR15]QPC92645.1 nuclear transport factor 2 family protein [Mesorhizobium sp. INR15]